MTKDNYPALPGNPFYAQYLEAEKPSDPVNSTERATWAAAYEQRTTNILLSALIALNRETVTVPQAVATNLEHAARRMGAAEH